MTFVVAMLRVQSYQYVPLIFIPYGKKIRSCYEILGTASGKDEQDIEGAVDEWFQNLDTTPTRIETYKKRYIVHFTTQ